MTSGIRVHFLCPDSSSVRTWKGPTAEYRINWRVTSVEAWRNCWSDCYICNYSRFSVLIPVFFCIQPTYIKHIILLPWNRFLTNILFFLTHHLFITRNACAHVVACIFFKYIKKVYCLLLFTLQCVYRQAYSRRRCLLLQHAETKERPYW